MIFYPNSQKYQTESHHLINITIIIKMKGLLNLNRIIKNHPYHNPPHKIQD